jgi:NAD(P)-dependent dehydrogenase (short-subunit alcohol dehydrogenase family)
MKTALTQSRVASLLLNQTGRMGNRIFERQRNARLLGALGMAAAGMAAWRLRPGYDLRGRVVVITGGSRGLGLVLARQIAQQGARVVLLARDAAELLRAREDLHSRGADVVTGVCDVRSQADVSAAIESVITRLGAIDVVINNAGIVQVGPIEHMQLSDFHDAMAVHLWGPLYVTLAALPHMRRRGGGRIVNISSVGGKVGIPHLVPYCASKFALVGLSDALRHELRRYDIRVTTVCPGLMRTGGPMHALFKGRHESEYAWFAALDALPPSSISAERAARSIVRALRQGRARVTLSLPAKLCVAADALSPALTAAAFDLMNRMLPRPTDATGDAMAFGWDSRGKAPRVLTHLSDRAAERNNEVAAFAEQSPETTTVGTGG